MSLGKLGKSEIFNRGSGGRAEALTPSTEAERAPHAPLTNIEAEGGGVMGIGDRGSGFGFRGWGWTELEPLFEFEEEIG